MTPRATRADPQATPQEASEETPDSPTDLPSSSIKDVVRRARREFRHDHLTDLAAGLTYYATLSAVPALIVLVAILGLLGPDTTNQLTNQVEAIAPGSSGDLVRNLLGQAQANRTGAGIGAIVGIVVALWSASGYVAAFMASGHPILRGRARRRGTLRVVVRPQASPVRRPSC